MEDCYLSFQSFEILGISNLFRILREGSIRTLCGRFYPDPKATRIVSLSPHFTRFIARSQGILWNAQEV